MSQGVSVNNVYKQSKAVSESWFGSPIQRTGNLGREEDPVYHHMEITLRTAAVVNIIRTGNESATDPLNDSVAVPAGIHWFAIKMNSGDLYNLNYTGIAGPQDISIRISEHLKPI